MEAMLLAMGALLVGLCYVLIFAAAITIASEIDLWFHRRPRR